MKNNIQFIEAKYETILNDQDNSDDVSYYTGAMLLLGGLLVVTFLGIFIKDNYSIRLLGFVAVLLISLIAYKSKVKKSIRETTSVNSEGASIQSSQLRHKLDLLQQSLDSRQARVSAVQQFYIFNFPIFLFSLKEFISGPLSSKMLFWSLLVSFLVGAIIWRMYFLGDRNRIADHQRAVVQMINDLE